MITLAGFDVESIRAAHSASERETALSRFNNKDSTCQFLLTSFQLGGQRLNVHKAANNGYVVQLPHNLNTVNQGLGRLTRIGQTRDVHWTILTTIGTYDAYHEARVTENMVSEVSATINLGRARRHIHGTTLDLVAYEAIRAMYGQPFNRFVWKAVKCEDVTAFHSLEVQRGLALIASFAAWL